MNEKNTQNAVAPTKGTRQYKHTPKGFKRLTSKILALVACLLLLVSIAIPSFADSSLYYGTQNLINLSPVLPVDRFVFPWTAYMTKSQFGNPFVLYERSAGSIAKDSVRYPMKVSADGVSPSGVYNTMDFTHYYNTSRDITTEFSSGGSTWWGLCSHSTSSTSYYFTEVVVHYQNTVLNTNKLPEFYIALDSSINPEGLMLKAESDYYVSLPDGSVDVCNVVKRYDVAGVTESSDNPYYICNVYDLFQEDYATLFDHYMINNLEVRLTFEQGGNQVSPLTTDGSFQYKQEFLYEGEFDNLQELPAFKVPEAIDTVGLFDWLADGIGGVLSTPLIPIGNYSISIGSILSVFLGILLVVSFLKIFAGG